MTPRECQVISRAEAGMKPKQIAAELGLKVSYVETIISNLLHVGGANTAFERMAKSGSAMLLAAIAKHHPEMIGASR